MPDMAAQPDHQSQRHLRPDCCIRRRREWWWSWRGRMAAKPVTAVQDCVSTFEVCNRWITWPKDHWPFNSCMRDTGSCFFFRRPGDNFKLRSCRQKKKKWYCWREVGTSSAIFVEPNQAFKAKTWYFPRGFSCYTSVVCRNVHCHDLFWIVGCQQVFKLEES